jgi:hypothetical protein
MWNLGYACANSSHKQRPEAGINPAGTICRHHNYHMCCKCGGRHSAWTCTTTIKADIHPLWAWPRTPPQGWNTAKQQKLEYWQTHMYQDTMWRPLEEGELPLPTPEYLLREDESTDDSPGLPPKRVAAPPGNPRLPPQAHPYVTKPRPSSGQPVGSSQDSLTSTSIPSKWKSAVVPPGPMTTGSLRGGCQPTQRTAPPALATFQALQPQSTSQKPSHQSLLGHFSPSSPPAATCASATCSSATCSLKQTETFQYLRIILLARGPLQKSRPPPNRQLDIPIFSAA